MDIRENIILLQGYYKQLQLGKFMEEIIKQNNLSYAVKDFDVKTGENSSFTIKARNIKKTLSDIHTNSRKQNLFGYLTEISSFGGIMGIMRELLTGYPEFNSFLKNILGNQYFSFEQIVFFTRNVLSHNASFNMKIDNSAISAQKQYLYKKNIKTIDFDFLYSKYIKVWSGSISYGLHINLYFPKIRQGSNLFKIISLHQLYKLIELCYNLSKVFINIYYPTTHRHTNTYPKKSSVQKKTPAQKKNTKTPSKKEVSSIKIPPQKKNDKTKKKISTKSSVSKNNTPIRKPKGKTTTKKATSNNLSNKKKSFSAQNQKKRSIPPSITQKKETNTKKTENRKNINKKSI